MITEVPDLPPPPPKTYIEEAKKIDRICRILFPVVFLVINIIYWSYYMAQYYVDVEEMCDASTRNE